MENRARASWNGASLAAAIGFLALDIAGAFTGPGHAPQPGPGDHKLVAFYALHHAAVFTSVTFFALSVVAFLYFVGSLWNVLREAEGSSALATMSLGGAVALMAAYVVQLALLAGTAQAALNGLQPDVVAALRETSTMVSNLSDILMGVFIAAASVVMLRSHLLPRWIGWVGVISGLCYVASLGQIFSADSQLGTAEFVGFVLLIVWTLATSIMLYRRSRPATRRATAEAQAYGLRSLPDCSDDTFHGYQLPGSWIHLGQVARTHGRVRQRHARYRGRDRTAQSRCAGDGSTPVAVVRRSRPIPRWDRSAG